MVREGRDDAERRTRPAPRSRLVTA